MQAGGAEVLDGFEQVLEFFPAFGAGVLLAFPLAFLPGVFEFPGEAFGFFVLPSALKLADLLFHPLETFFIGEAGIPAPSPFPFSYAQRAQYMDDKITAQWSAGSDGFLIWSWYDLKSDNSQGWDFNAQDPLAAIVAKHAAEKP